MFDGINTRILPYIVILSSIVLEFEFTSIDCTKWNKELTINKNEREAIIDDIKSDLPIFTKDVNVFDVELAIKQYHESECQEDVILNITQLLTKNGYPVEQYEVITCDGYKLTMFRIPSKGPVVFLMHGLLSSSDDWVTTGKERGLAYLLADEGYDVWLGNARGNVHSRSNVYLSPDCKEFWDFSWDEIGRYDLPAMIDYILASTNQQQLQFVGHSQGTTAFFVLCSEKPEYNAKVAIMIALSAVAWMSHLKSPFLRLLAPVYPLETLVLQAIGQYEVMPRNKLTDDISLITCGAPEIGSIFCSSITFLVVGFDYAQINCTYLPAFYNHFPAGSSSKQFVHYGQEIDSAKFRRYDYGVLNNLIKYGSPEPPEYPVEKITVPMVIFHSDNDWLSSFKDVKILISKLPNLKGLYRVPFKMFNHGDYIYANEVKMLVYDKLMTFLSK